MSKKKEETELMTREPNETAMAVAYDYGTDAGDGLEDIGSSDVKLPYINLLQALSPEVAGGEGEAIDGAKPGKFLNSVTKEVYDTVIIQPVMRRHCYVEWLPDRGGKVGEYTPESPIVREAMEHAKAKGFRFNQLTTEDGNLLTETFYILCFMHTDNGPVPAMLSITSTKISGYRDMMTRLTTFRIAGKQPPIYAHRWQLQSFPDRNSANQPFHNLKIVAPVNNNILASMIPASETNLLDMAKALKAAYEAGTAKTVEDGIGKDELPI